MLFEPVAKTAIDQTVGTTISQTGIIEIASLLAKEGILIPWTFADWTTATENGRFTKRLGKAIYEIGGIKVATELLAKAGEIAEANRDINGVSHWDITDDFAWTHGDYGDEGSCFWGGYSIARDIIQNQGGLAFRLYENGVGRARMFLMPIDPANKEDNWIAFNAYSQIHSFSTGHGTNVLPGIVAALLDWTGKNELHRKRINVSFNPPELFYLNGGVAFVLSKEEYARNSVTIYLENPNQINCPSCGRPIAPTEKITVLTKNGLIQACDECHPDKVTCPRCGILMDRDAAVTVNTATISARLCPDCAATINRVKYSYWRR